MALALAVGVCALGTLGGAAWSRFQNGEPFGRRVAAAVPQDARLLVERGKFEMVLYYAQRRGTEFETDEQLLRYACEGGPFAPRGSAQYAVVEEPTYERLKDAPPLAGVPVVLRERVSRTTYVIAGPL